MAIQLDQRDAATTLKKSLEEGRSFPDAAAFVSAAVRHFLITRAKTSATPATRSTP